MKGKWFLEYTRNYHFTAPGHIVGPTAQTERIGLTDTHDVDEPIVLKKAMLEWEKVISQYPKGIREYGMGVFYSQPREPRIVLQIEAEFPECPKMDPKIARFILL